MFAWLFFVSVSLAFGLSALIVGTKRYHMAHSAQVTDTGAVQSAHRNPTPRIGGVAWFLAICLTTLFVSWESPGGNWLYVLSTLPIFLTGLAEDLTRKVSPKIRYIAAIVSGALAIALLGFWIDRIDAPVLGWLVGFAPIGILLTLFVTASYAHAFNLVDGLNGLSSGVAAVGGLAMTFIAFDAGATDLAKLLMISVGALLGFMMLNFPSGKIFLGDAGAYSIGHLMAWSSLGVYAATPELTCWALLLAFFWPLADTLFAMARRVGSGKRIDTADRMHLHHLVMRGIEIRWLGRNSRHLANPLGTLVILPFASIPPVLGVCLWNQPLAAFVALLCCGLGYVGLYNLAFAAGARRKLINWPEERATRQLATDSKK